MQVLSDSRMMRQQLQAMRDPQMRQMMMRNADRAMSNLETVRSGASVQPGDLPNRMGVAAVESSATFRILEGSPFGVE